MSSANEYNFFFHSSFESLESLYKFMYAVLYEYDFEGSVLSNFCVDGLNWIKLAFVLFSCPWEGK